MSKRRRRSAARLNTGVLCHECHTVLPTQQQHQEKAGACQRRIPTHHFVLSTSFSCQLDALKIGLSLSFSYDRPPPANCSFSCQLLWDSSSHHRDRVDLQSNRPASSRQNRIKSAPISVQKPSTPATAPLTQFCGQ